MAEYTDVLVFSLGERRLGVILNQVDRIVHLSDAKSSRLKIFQLYGEPPIQRGDAEDSQKILIPKHAPEPCGLLINQPEDILTISLDDIHALPLLIKKNIASEIFFGVVLKENKFILLIDLEIIRGGPQI